MHCGIGAGNRGRRKSPGTRCADLAQILEQDGDFERGRVAVDAGVVGVLETFGTDHLPKEDAILELAVAHHIVPPLPVFASFWAASIMPKEGVAIMPKDVGEGGRMLA
jgi:hypothetical protein